MELSIEGKQNSLLSVGGAQALRLEDKENLVTSQHVQVYIYKK